MACIAAGDAADAALYASLLAHEAGYQAWVLAKLEGRAYLAPASSRLPIDWSDPTRTTTGNGGAAW